MKKGKAPRELFLFFSFLILGNSAVSILSRQLSKSIFVDEFIYFRYVTFVFVSFCFLFSVFFFYKIGSSSDPIIRKIISVFCALLFFLWFFTFYFFGMASPISLLMYKMGSY